MEEITPNRIWFRWIRLHQRGHAFVTQKLRAIGLSVPQFDALSTLSEKEGITQQELAERLYVTKGNVSGLMDRLVALELVERRSLPNDRRSYALFLTQKGREAAFLGMKQHQAVIEKTLGVLPTADLDALEKIITRWREKFRELAANEQEMAGLPQEEAVAHPEEENNRALYS